MKKKEFLKIAYQLNKKLNIMPLLFGSLGLEQRLTISLNAEDIDVLIPKEFINEKEENLLHDFRILSEEEQSDVEEFVKFKLYKLNK